MQEKDEETISILARYLAQIISKSATQDPNGLEQALQSIISPVIAKEISENKDKMIDALYPIMGGMISKYVAQAIKELMETINKKIEQGFSVERYKRKLKAKLSGVSETELLLEESADAHILAMFIIHKESGLLISEAHTEESNIGDPHMVASMASAIKDFINDWISNNKAEKEEVQILSYGKETLYIESAGSVYLIAFLDSDPDYEMRSDINDFFASIVKRYADFFQSFNGDDAAKEVHELSKKMYAYLISHNDRQPDGNNKKSFNPAKWGLIFLLSALLFYVGYRLKIYYDMNMLENRVTEQTGEIVTIKNEEGHYILKGILKEPSHFKAIQNILSQSPYAKEIGVDLSLSVGGVKKLIAQQKKQLEAQKEMLLRLNNAYQKDLQTLKHQVVPELDTLKKEQTQLKKLLESYKNEKRKLQQLMELEKNLYAALDHAFANNPYYIKKTHNLNFAPLHLFEVGKVEPTGTKLPLVTASFKKYLHVLLPYKPYIKQILILSFSDTKGNAVHNQLLTEKRAKNMLSYFLKDPAIAHSPMRSLIQTRGEGEKFPVMVNGQEDMNASRRIEIQFTLDHNKINSMINHYLEKQ